MSVENNSKKREEHLNLINQKFDELDELITDYLNDVRKHGGTFGFCIGGLRGKIRYCRERINNMCGRFSDYIPKIKTFDNTSQNTKMNSNIYWESNLRDYITQNHPDMLYYDAKLLEITKDNISFGMKNHMGILILSKKKIIETLFPDLN